MQVCEIDHFELCYISSGLCFRELFWKWLCLFTYDNIYDNIIIQYVYYACVKHNESAHRNLIWYMCYKYTIASRL